MTHIGKNTRSTILAKGISAGHAHNTYRGLVRINPKADNSWNFTQCDSLLIGDQCGAHTPPYVEVKNNSAHSLIINGCCKEVFRQLPLEFAVEATRLLEMNLENTVG